MLIDVDGEIRTRAYAIWEAEGRPDGRSLEHWLMAEAQAKPRRGASRARATAKATPARRKVLAAE